MQRRSSKEIALSLGLREEDYRKILEILGRDPTPTEVAMFSVEWSEHCGYTHSRSWFKFLPRQGKFQALVGEDAGGIVYDGLALVFKMESHNHPSQVEPKQGAATGVGGIIRDILGSGARPIACLDSLRFAPPDENRSRYIFKGVVDGIAFYGNCVGVPTVAGELYFHPSFRGNCLVNVMCIGLVPEDGLMRAMAKGEGNAIIYVGNKTGRDGIGGCSILASQEFAGNEEKRPSVQIGDPFTEKCLIEATLEAIKSGKVIGIKDMGAAGLTCSTSEMAAAGDSGMEVDLDRVPVREEGMEAWEIMMSESQERMLLCVEKGSEEKICDIFRKWGLEAEVIGRVVNSGRVIIRYRGEVVADVPAKALTTPPSCVPPFCEPPYFRKINSFSFDTLPVPEDFNPTFLSLLASPNLCSRRFVYEQYDHMVQTNTVIYPGSGTVVLRVKGKSWGIAVTTDCNPLYCFLNPYQGAQMAVAEAARNLVCCGAIPAGITDCLNFGNPEKPDRYWQFVEAVKGLSEAARYFDIPVVSGNVSFYNESLEGSIYPTPTVGMIGIVEDVSRVIPSCFSKENLLIVLLGECRDGLGGSEYLKVVHNLEVGPLPHFDLEMERKLQEVLIELVKEGCLCSAMDVSEGGLAMALAEASLSAEVAVGFNVDISDCGDLREDVVLFGEAGGRAVVTIEEENFPKFEKILLNKGFPFRILGKSGGKYLIFRKGEKELIKVSTEVAKKHWEVTF